MMSKDEFLAEMDKRQKERKEQEAKLAQVLKQRRIEAGNTIPILSFFGTNHQGVAIIQDFGDCLRISRFTDIGPMGHLDVKDPAKLAYELWMEGFTPVDDPNAAATLEYWSRQPKWAEGLTAMQIAATANTLSYHGYNDQANEVRRQRNLALGYQYCRQFGLNAY